MAKDDKKFGFEKDERVLCYHGPYLYEAKILRRERKDTNEEEPRQYFVHYKGWKHSWDEWVPEDRVLRLTESNLLKQQRLKENLSKRKLSRSAVSLDSTQSRSRKRYRESSAEKSRAEKDAAKQATLEIAIPEPLKNLLVDDWENVIKNKQVVQLPHTIPISEILQQYAASKGDLFNESESLALDGIKLYFNKTLRTLLLYRLERKQYDELRSTHSDKDLTDIYGIEHLLRLFVEMPELISQAKLDNETLVVLQELLADLLRFVQDHTQKYFQNAYISL